MNVIHINFNPARVDPVYFPQLEVVGGHRLENADLAGLLKECLAAAGAHVIDVPLDYSDNEHVMSHELKQLSATI